MRHGLAPDRIDLPTSMSLVVRLRRQDADGWRDFVTLYAPLVARWCTRRGFSEHDSVDIAQEVFAKVAAHIDRFHKDSPQDSLRGWLYRIVQHAIVDFVRCREEVAAGGTDALLRFHDVAESPSRSAAEPDEADCVAETSYLYQQAMKVAQSEFSERMWQMFWRMAVDGNSATAVAAEFGVTATAVRTAKSRVLRRLKQLVGDVPE